MEWLLKEKYGGEKSEAFFADCKKMALGEPLGYLIGHVPFLDTTIYLDSRPLVPRSETEFWTEHAINVIKDGNTPSLGFTDNPPRVLDLCAGSGCIGVAVAKVIPTAHVDFSEIEARHIPTIKKNLEKNGIKPDRTDIFQTNLFQGLSGQYDYILANPPYVDADLHRVDDSVVDFEPHLALFGGKQGVEIIAQIIVAAPAFLTPHGQLWIEHEPEQTTLIASLAADNGFSCTTRPDQYEVERYSILVLQ